jgi:cyanophycin synthetase
VERFVPGDNYRLLVYKGEVLSAILRELPQVTGDGRSTVAELIEEENRHRIRPGRWTPGDPVLMPLPAGDRVRHALAQAGLALSTVPESGRRVNVSGTCSYAAGASYEEMSDRMHPTILESARRAAAALHLVLAGVDVIAPQPDASAHFINEVNTTPGLESHYFVRDPHTQRDPIGHILADLFGRA